MGKSIAHVKEFEEVPALVGALADHEGPIPDIAG
jgi:hypothetical protein